MKIETLLDWRTWYFGFDWKYKVEDASYIAFHLGPYHIVFWKEY